MTKEELKQQWETAYSELSELTKKFNDIAINATTVANEEIVKNASALQKEWVKAAERTQAAMKAFYEK